MYGGINGKEGYYYPVILMLREQENPEKKMSKKKHLRKKWHAESVIAWYFKQL